MPIEVGGQGDRMPGHEPEVWPPWLCQECSSQHESDPRQGCPGFKRKEKQPTLEEMQGAKVHGEVANNAPTPRKLPTSSLADRISTAPSANPVLLDSIRMIVREELKGGFNDREKYAITQGLKVVLSILAKGRTPEDEDVFPSDDALQALIERLEQ